MKNIIVLSLVLLLALSVGCAAQSPTQSVPTQPDTAATDYPSTVNLNPITSGYPAPGSDYPGPGGAPAVEARANIKVELIEQSDDAGIPGQVILKVKLLSATPAEDSPDRFTPIIGQNIDLHAVKESLPSLAVGDTFTADVVYQGDEKNVYIAAENIQK